MDKFTYTMSNGETVELINRSGTDWFYEVHIKGGDRLGKIWIDEPPYTNDEVLKPFAQELFDFIDEQTTPPFMK